MSEAGVKHGTQHWLASQQQYGLPQVGERYRHYKGGLYTLVLVSVKEDTGDVLISYESAEGKAKGWVPWTRTLINFLGLVQQASGNSIRRFTRVDEPVDAPAN